MRLDRRPWRRLTVVRDWPLWSLPRWLTVFVLAVAAVYFQVNNSGWNLAIGTNEWSSGPFLLPPGKCEAQAYAVDTSGNSSKTKSVLFVNAPRAPLTLSISGQGTVSPKSGLQYLSVGKPYRFICARYPCSC